MGSKIQGEGDYEAARRFNRNEQEFVRRKFGKRKIRAMYPADESDLYESQDIPEIEATERGDLEFLQRQGIQFPDQ